VEPLHGLDQTPWTHALLNAPSATKIGLSMIDHANAYGFVVLHLQPAHADARFVLFGADGRALDCDS